MSIIDFLPSGNDDFRQGIRVDSKHWKLYLSKEGTPDKNVILTAHIPYACLMIWHEARRKAIAENIKGKYVEIFKVALFEETGLRIKDDNERIEGRLRRECGTIKRKFAQGSGPGRRSLSDKELHLAVQLDDLVSLADLEQKFTTEQRKNEELEERCYNLLRVVKSTSC